MLQLNKLLIVLVALLTGTVCFAQSMNSGALGIVAADNGSYVVAGSVKSADGSTQMCAIKYDLNGDTLWTRYYSGGGEPNDNKAYAITIDKQWNIIITGYSNTANGIAMTTIKYDPNGNELWNKKFPENGGGTSKAYAITIDSYNSIYITGYTTDSQGAHFVTIKYLPDDGQMAWNKIYPGGNADTSVAIAMVGDSYVAVTGCSLNYNNNTDIVTIEYNTNDGTQKWVSRSSGSDNLNDKGNAIISDGVYVYITGYTTRLNTERDIVTIKYGPYGGQRWATRSDIHGFNDMGNSIGLTSTFDVVVTGAAGLSDGSTDYVTLKYNNLTGAIAWNKTYNGPGSSVDIANKLVVADNTIYVTGSSKSTSLAGSEDMFTIVYDLLGDTLGTSRVHPDSSGGTIAMDIAVDSSNNVIVTGFTVPIGDMANTINKVVTASVGKFVHKTSKVNQPKSFKLFQNYPNPFNPVTQIKFEIARSTMVKLIVYDLLGRKVQTLVDNNLTPGNYSVSFGNPELSSGVYFYQLTADGFRDIKKMVILK